MAKNNMESFEQIENRYKKSIKLGILFGIVILMIAAPIVSYIRGEFLGKCLNEECVGRKLAQGWDMRYCDRAVTDYEVWNVTCYGSSFTYCDVGTISVGNKVSIGDVTVPRTIQAINTSQNMEYFHENCELELTELNGFEI